MDWIDFVWPMATGAFLTMALVHLRTGLRKHGERVNVLFAVAAIFAAIYSWFELRIIQAGSPAEYLAQLRYLDLAAGGMVVSLAAFVWGYFGTGRKWLGLIAIGVTLGSLIPDLLPVPKLVFLEVTGIRKVSTFGGATFTLAEGVNSPWNLIFYGGVCLVLAFVVDASLRLWKRGDRRKASVVGGTVILFYLVAGVQALLTDQGVLGTPYLTSFFWMAILVVMAAKLSDDQLRARKLTHDLHENQERMRLAARAANISLWEWDVSRDEVWASASGGGRTRISGSKPMNLETYIELLHPDDRERTWQAVREAVGGGRELRVEFRMANPSGETVWLAARGQVERDAQGKPLQLRGISIDITERKQAEAELLRQRSELMHIQRVSAMGQLSSTLAHELSQPLGAILRNAEAGELFLKQDLPDIEEVKAILADIRRDDQRAVAVIERMRSLLKRRDPTLETLSVDELIEQSAALLQPEFQVRHVTFRVEVPHTLPKVRGDRVHLQQVILNLLINSLDAMESAPNDQRQVIIRASESSDGMVETAVIDQGTGIAPDRLLSIFDPFVTTKTKGTGIGLAISKKIIELHGGRIWAENNPQGGTTFCFTLNVVQSEGGA